MPPAKIANGKHKLPAYVTSSEVVVKTGSFLFSTLKVHGKDLTNLHN